MGTYFERTAITVYPGTGGFRATRAITPEVAVVADEEPEAAPMRISPHLCFDGQCAEAFRHYHHVLGGRIATMLTYGESPLAAQTPPEYHNRIVHATLELDGVELTGVDVPPREYRRPQGFFVTLTAADEADAQRCFLSLSDGGTVLMPYQETFWSAGFGVLIDRFGIPWEINCAQSPRQPST